MKLRSDRGTYIQLWVVGEEVWLIKVKRNQKLAKIKKCFGGVFKSMIKKNIIFNRWWCWHDETDKPSAACWISSKKEFKTKKLVGQSQIVQNAMYSHMYDAVIITQLVNYSCHSLLVSEGHNPSSVYVWCVYFHSQSKNNLLL